MKINRRKFITTGAIAAAGLSALSNRPSFAKIHASVKRHNRIGVSTYSFWQFNGPKENQPMEYCIDQAARIGFDGVELAVRPGLPSAYKTTATTVSGAPSGLCI